MHLTDSTSSYFRNFYDVTGHFAERFDKFGRKMAFMGKTRKEAMAWQRKLRAKTGQLLGLDAFESTPARPKLLRREDMGLYWREDWRIYTEPNVIAPFYALVPKKIKKGERLPAVICPHGHDSGGRFSPAGRHEFPPIAKTIKTYNYDYAVRLVKQGFITFAMDSRGFGQRRIQERQKDKVTPQLFLQGSCHELMLMGVPLGQTVIGMWVWDLMRLIDYIQTRPECDSDRIGCAGLSGGGYQALFLAALDSRVQASIVSGYFYGVKDSLIHLASNCACNCVPNLWSYADMGDIGGLIAPRGLFIETGDNDPLNGKIQKLDNVRSQVRITRNVYRALDSHRQFVHHIFRGGHRWCGEKSEPWLKQQLDF